MITDKRKLFIFISVKAFRTSDKKLLETYVNNLLKDFNEEEIKYAMSLFS